jgi:hypothetical protein
MPQHRIPGSFDVGTTTAADEDGFLAVDAERKQPFADVSAGRLGGRDKWKADQRRV